MSLGLLSSRRRRSAAAVPAIPAVAAGQTLLLDERFTATRTAGAPGPWDSVVNTLPGGYSKQPSVRVTGSGDLGTYAAVPLPTSAESAAGGYSVPYLTWTVPGGSWSAGKTLLIDMWVRPSQATMTAGRTVLFTTDEFGNALEFLSWGSSDDGRQRLVGGAWNGVTDPTTIGDYHPAGCLWHVWLAVTHGGRRSLYYEIPELETGVVLLSDAPTSAGYPSPFLIHLGTDGSIAANQPYFSGQLHAVAVFACTSYAVAAVGRSDYARPAGSITNDQTFSQTVADWNAGILVGSSLNVRKPDNSRADLAALTTTADRVAFDRTVRAQTYKVNPTNPRVRLPAGVERPGAALAWELNSSPVGLFLDGRSGAAELRATEVLADTWAAADLTGTADVYRFTGAVRTGCLAEAPSRRRLAAIQGADATEAVSRLAVRPWQQWLKSDGTLYVSLPKGTTPGAGWERFLPQTASGSVLPAMDGAVVKGVKASLTGYWDSQAGLSDRALAAYIWWATTGRHVTVFDGLVGLGQTKHQFANVPVPADGLFVAARVRFGGCPPMRDGRESWYSTDHGDYTCTVDFCPAATTHADPGSAVTAYHDPVFDDDYHAVAGQVEGDGEAADLPVGGSYYRHGTGGEEMFAHTTLGGWPDDSLGAGSPPDPATQGEGTPTTVFEIIA